MDTVRIAELLQPFISHTPESCHSESGRRPSEEPAVLSPVQLSHISTYIDILLRWNSSINLTAIREPEEIVTRHFGESFFAARHLLPTALSRPPEQSPAIRVADLGSGAGFPGIPLKLWAPEICLSLIESNQKKCTFLREVARTLTLTDVNIQSARAETISPAAFDIVTMRAVERLTDLLPVAASLLAAQGRLALLISESQVQPIRSGLPALSWNAPLPIPQSQSRLLVIGQKLA